MNKKGAVPLALIFGVILVLIIIYYISWETSKECGSDMACGTGYYCGSDFECHQIPVIEKSTSYSLIWPAAIIGLSIIIAAIIMKRKRNKTA